MLSTGVKNPFAKRGEKYLTIYDLLPEERGAACGCKCPSCDSPFEARMGEVRVWHFAHTGEPCDETKRLINSLYGIAKQMIEDAGRFVCPNGLIEKEVIVPSGTLQVARVELVEDSNGLCTAMILNEGQLAVKLWIDRPDYCCVPVYLRQYKKLRTVGIVADSTLKYPSERLTRFFVEDNVAKWWVYSEEIEREKTIRSEHLREEISRKQDGGTMRTVWREDESDSIDEYLPVRPRRNSSYYNKQVRCIHHKGWVHKDDACSIQFGYARKFICYDCIEKYRKENGLSWEAAVKEMSREN